ncbi:hypothetical protein PoB_001267400 [Plakobranchus ocellatus]|uniref:Uncharacterized protein n=1 Tax=Plakobranchus ocellatus TaxID=259542 RepID=A0AAV3YWS1_9GAST|nr:hypothetical protein PoB_001267400 [Plakobranchus ocellatus]
MGFCLDLQFRETNCPWKEIVRTSKDVVVKEEDDDGASRNGKERENKINLRMVLFARSIGRRHGALTKFSMQVNSPAPMTRKNFRNTFMKMHAAVQEVAEESMMKAAKELMDLVL